MKNIFNFYMFFAVGTIRMLNSCKLVAFKNKSQKFARTSFLKITKSGLKFLDDEK